MVQTNEFKLRLQIGGGRGAETTIQRHLQMVALVVEETERLTAHTLEGLQALHTKWQPHEEMETDHAAGGGGGKGSSGALPKITVILAVAQWCKRLQDWFKHNYAGGGGGSSLEWLMIVVKTEVEMGFNISTPNSRCIQDTEEVEWLDTPNTIYHFNHRWQWDSSYKVSLQSIWPKFSKKF